MLTPCWVSRVNLYPYGVLRAHDGGLLDQSRIDGLLVEQKLRADLSASLLPALAEAIGMNPKEASKTWIPLRRDIYNNRRPTRSWGQDAETAKIPGLDQWFASWECSSKLQQELSDSSAGALEKERSTLRLWSQDPDVQRSTVMTSSSLFHGVQSLAEAGTELTKRQRKSEPSLVHYFARATTKVSPFSLYTGTRFHPMDGSPEETTSTAAVSTPGSITRNTRVALRRLYVRQAARRLSQDPVDKWNLPWKLSDGVESTEDGVLIRQRTWRSPATGMKADTFLEDVTRIPIAGSWIQVWPILHRICTEATPLLDIAMELADKCGWQRQDAEKILETLIGLKALVPVVPIHEQSPNYEREWLDYLEGFSGAAAQHLRDALQATEEVIQQWSENTGTERAAIVGRLEKLWARALDLPNIDNPLVEDCYVGTGAPVDDARIVSWTQDFSGLLPMLVAQDDQRILAAALEKVFTDTYGVHGRCRDLRQFARLAYAAFPLTQQLLSGESKVETESPLGHLLRSRGTMTAHLVELSRSGQSPVEVDRTVLDRVADQLPDREWSIPRSVSVFGQAAGDEFVLNHLYGGRGRYFSRFLNDQDPDVKNLVRNAVAGAAPAGAQSLHMRPSLGFNANLNPLMSVEELRLTDEYPGPSARTRLEDLELVHGACGLRLVRKDNGNPVEILYTGFLVPHALPSEEMLLAMVAGAPYFSFSELTLDLHERLMSGQTPVVSAPRIRHAGITLFRHRYGFKREFLDASNMESTHGTPVDPYRDLNVRRTAHGLPAEVFMRPLLGRQITPIERAMSPRPQYVDFLSRLHASGLHKRTGKLGETLLAEEFHPHPELFGTETDRGRHSAELFFEIALTQGGSNE